MFVAAPLDDDERRPSRAQADLVSPMTTMRPRTSFDRRAALLGLGAGCLLGLGACASRRAAPLPPPQFSAIAVVPIAPPSYIYSDNAMLNIPVLPAMISNAIANRIKSNVLANLVEDTRLKMGDVFTAMVLDELRAAQIPAQPMPAFARDPKAPNDLEYDKLPTRDAVLHIILTDASVVSTRLSSVYLPRLNVEAYFLPSTHASDEQWQYRYYRYGVDADADHDPQSIASPERFRFASFGVIADQPQLLIDAWTDGMHEIARRIARDMPRPTSAPASAG